MNKFQSRKFVLALLTLLLANVQVWFGKIEPAIYLSLITAIVGAYMAANYLQKKVEVAAGVEPEPLVLGAGAQ
jgi:hypothetical protein